MPKYGHLRSSIWQVRDRCPGGKAPGQRLATAGSRALIQDLHPADRGPRGTHEGAIIANGNLYCPATPPPPLLGLRPLARDATPQQASAHDQQSAELAWHKLGKITADDPDGYHRVMCPAVMGKIRCPLRPDFMTLTRGRPEILTSPEHPPACCQQQIITVPPQVAAKTVAVTGQWWLDARKPKVEVVAAHLINLAWNGLSRLDHAPSISAEAAGRGATSRR